MGAGFTGGLDWCVLMKIIISNHADNVLGWGFFGACEFSILSGGDICKLDSLLVHEVLTDSDGSFFEIVGLGRDP